MANKNNETNNETKTRRPRKKDDTLVLFPELEKQIEAVKLVVRALKAVRKVLVGESGAWPAAETAALIQALQEQVRPSPPMSYDAAQGLDEPPRDE